MNCKQTFLPLICFDVAFLSTVLLTLQCYLFITSKCFRRALIAIKRHLQLNAMKHATRFPFLLFFTRIMYYTLVEWFIMRRCIKFLFSVVKVKGGLYLLFRFFWTHSKHCRVLLTEHYTFVNESIRLKNHAKNMWILMKNM